METRSSFIKEIVPKPAPTIVANTVYKEHYQTLRMKHSITENKQEKNDFLSMENRKQMEHHTN